METKYKEKLIEAAHAGGAVLRKYFGQALNPKEKAGPSDLQTEADLGSEKIILEILKKEFPEYNIHSEEDGITKNDSDYTFYIDPLDGTNNFTIGIPNFTVSIGLVHKNEIIAGVVYQPMLDHTYYAELGGGAYLNDKKIQVNNINTINRTTVAMCFTYKTDKKHKADIFSALIQAEPKRIIWNWSVAYDCCLIASGKIEAMTNQKLEIYDWAAGKLIAKEAGAKIIDFDGNEETNMMNDNFIVGNNTETAQQILKILKPLE